MESVRQVLSSQSVPRPPKALSGRSARDDDIAGQLDLAGGADRNFDLATVDEKHRGRKQQAQRKRIADLARARTCPVQMTDREPHRAAVEETRIGAELARLATPARLGGMDDFALADDPGVDELVSVGGDRVGQRDCEMVARAAALGRERIAGLDHQPSARLELDRVGRDDRPGRRRPRGRGWHDDLRGRDRSHDRDQRRSQSTYFTHSTPQLIPRDHANGGHSNSQATVAISCAGPGGDS